MGFNSTMSDSDRNSEIKSLDQSVARVDDELWATRVLMEKLMRRLEENIGKDIDGDGKVG